jgi:hypothetical protein
MLESPGDRAYVRAERSHAPGAAKHLDYEPAGYRGRVKPHATPVLFSTSRVSSSVNELLDLGYFWASALGGHFYRVFLAGASRKYEQDASEKKRII